MRLRAVWISLTLMPAFALVAPPSINPSLAVTNFEQAKAADKALSYASSYGGKACQDANSVSPQFDPGECKEFVRCIYKMASGGQIQLGGGFYSDYERYGGRVTSSEAVKGDIIQLNDPGNLDGFRRGMHTAIIVANLGNNNFDVVDSNFQNDYLARRHTWNPYDSANANGLVVNIWRLGQVGIDPATRNPFGNYEELLQVPGGLWPKGWAIDPDLGTGSADVIFYLDGTPHPRKADKDRPDVGAAFPGYGNAHGFGDLLMTGGGWHTVDVKVLNYGAGTGDKSLGSRQAFVPYSVGENAKDLPSGVSGVQAFRNSYDSYGGAAVIGLAENAVHPDPRGIAQLQDTRGGTHRRGLLVQRGLYPVFVVSGDHRDYLENQHGGSVFNVVGYPRNNNHGWGNGGTQDFDGGSLGSVLLMKGNFVGRVYKVFGGIRQAYVNQYGGAPGKLGYPVSDEYPWNGEIHQGFEGGWIQWYGSGARVIWR